MEKRGKLILIEGPDGCGKETQTKMLVNRLNVDGFPSESMSFPAYDKTPFGRILGQCYLGKTDLGEKLGWQGDYKWFGEDNNKVDPRLIAMVYAADRKMMEPLMTQILKSGKNLILDRYTESNVAHQGAKIGVKDPRFTRFEEFVYQLEYKNLALRIPDIFFLLHMPWNIAVEQRKNRVGVADIIEADIENLKRAEEVYLYLAEKWEWKKIDCAPDGTVKSKKYPRQIHEEIYSYVKEILS